MGLSFQSKLLECCVAVLLLHVIIGVVGLIKQGEQGYAEQTNLQNGLQKIKDQWVPEDKIRKWWYKAEADHRKFPRVYPWCFSLNSQEYPVPAKINRFVKAMKSVNDVRGYDPDLHSWEAYKAKGTGLITEIQVKRMEIEPSQPSVLGEAGQRNMDQWICLIVNLRTPLRYLYAQSIGGPLGVPTGDFSNEMKCTEGFQDPSNYQSETHIVPCHFAPKSAYLWPNVFVYEAAQPQTSMSFKFRWTEMHCLETTFVQFILIAIDDSQKHDVVLSGMLRFINLDTLAVIPFPYHPFHSKVYCQNNKGHAQSYQDKRRLIANKEYDDCVLGMIKPDKTGINRDKCPPGPFKCTPKWTTAAQWKNLGNDWEKLLIVEPKAKCCEMVFPLKPPPPTTAPPTTKPPTGPTTKPPTTKPTTGPTTKPPTTNGTTIPPYTAPPTAPSVTESPQQKRQKEQETYFTKRTLKYELKNKITHGDFCILIWLILAPLADYIARYFKDYADLKRFGLGMWIILHVMIHASGLLMMWWAMGLIIGSSSEHVDENVTVQHYVAGGIALFLQHVQFVTGLKRAEKDSKSFAWVLIHSACGYFSHCVGYVAIALSTAGAERKWMSLALFLVGLVASVALFIAEKVQERILKVVPHRAQCPVLQRIFVFGGPPPMGKVKIMIVACLITAQVGVYLYMLFVHSAERLALQKIAGEDIVANDTSNMG